MVYTQPLDLSLYLYCILWELAKNTSVPIGTCLHAHSAGSLPSTTQTRPVTGKQIRRGQMPFCLRQNRTKIPKIGFTDASGKMFILRGTEWWPLVSPNRVLLAGPA